MTNFNDIEDMIYSRIKYGVSKELKDNFPSLNFTTSDKILSIPDKLKFPCVYIHQLDSSETAQTFNNNKLNAGRFNLQIEVYDNESQDNTKEVMDEIISIVKKIGFNLNGIPFNQNNKDTYRRIMRINRLIGDSDIL